MPPQRARAHLRRQLAAHLTELGYSLDRVKNTLEPVPEFVRISPFRGRLVYGETVLRSDLHLKSCHERLLVFSQRRTKSRSSILFFIGVAEADEAELRTLLEELDVRNATRGGHVHVVPIADAAAPKAPKARETSKPRDIPKVRAARKK